MVRFSLILACCFSLFAGSGALGVDLPGCIVYSDGANAYSLNLKTGEQKQLAASVGDRCAISDGGCYLSYRKAGKFYTLNTRTKTTTVSSFSQSGAQNAPLPDFPIHELRVTPDGQKLAYGFLGTGTRWVANPTPIGNVYRRELDTCQAVNVIPAIGNRLVPQIQAWDHLTWKGNCMDGMFGNTAFYNPPEGPPFRIADGDGSLRSTPGYQAGRNPVRQSYQNLPSLPHLKGENTLPFLKSSVGYTLPEAMQKFNTRRNACFPAFSRGKDWENGTQQIAVIYQTDRGYGPIEIFELNPLKLSEEKKLGFYEIPVQFTSCSGMDFTPEGSLMLIADGKAMIIKGDNIRNGILNAGTMLDNTWARANRLNASAAFVVSANHVFPIVPQPISNGLEQPVPVKGSNLCAVSEDSFLILGEDKFVYAWSRGNVEKVFEIPVSGFSYCNPDAVSSICKETALVIPSFTDYLVGKRAKASLWSADSRRHTNVPFPLSAQWKRLGNKVSVIVDWSNPAYAGKTVSFAIVEGNTLTGMVDPFSRPAEEKSLPLTFSVDPEKSVALFKNPDASGCLGLKFFYSHDKHQISQAMCLQWWK